MQRGLRQYARSPLLPLTAALMVLVGLLLGSGESGLRCARVASAANGQLPSDYCFTVPISLTLGSSATSTRVDQAVRVAFNASGLINSNLMDGQTWDAHPATSGFQETDLGAQDLTSATASWWFHAPQVAPGATSIVDLYFGSDIQRDQGLLFVGNDTVTVAHHADFNITDALTLSVRIEMMVLTQQTATLASHRNGSSGYSLSLVNSGGNLTLRGQVDGQTCDLDWPDANIPVDEVATVDMTYNQPNLVLTIYGSDGTSEGSQTCNTGLGALSTTTTAFTVGNSLSRAIIRDVKLQSGSATNLHWGMNPAAMTETVTTNPYGGTITDESPLSHNGTYSLDRDQSLWSYSIGGVRLVSAGGAIPPTPTTDVNLLGANNYGITLDITATPATDTFSRLFGAAVASYADQGGNRTFAWTLSFIVAALGFALIAWVGLRSIPLAILFAGVPLVYGLVRGYVPGWVLLVWSIGVIGAWFGTRRGESPGG